MARPVDGTRNASHWWQAMPLRVPAHVVKAQLIPPEEAVTLSQVGALELYVHAGSNSLPWSGGWGKGRGGDGGGSKGEGRGDEGSHGGREGLDGVREGE
jgi:hypothetical protein